MKQRNSEIRNAYDPNRLLDTLLKRLGLEQDQELSRQLRLAPNILKNIRTRRQPLGASLLMWIQEATGISVPELRQILGDRRQRFRLSYAYVAS